MKNISKVISLLAGFVSITAIAGGIGLILTNGLGMEASELRGTPFGSFLIPGLVLLFVVGGTHAIAAVLEWQDAPRAAEASIIASAGLLIWLAVQLYVLGPAQWLQILYTCIGVGTLALAGLQAVLDRVEQKGDGPDDISHINS